MRLMTLTLAFLTLFICVAGVKAADVRRWPVSKAAQRWKPDRQWLRGAFCIHNHESVDWHLAWRDYRGNPSPYAGGMQFLQSTWTNAGGRGEPWQWAPREQLYRAWIVWKADGGSWVEWGTRGYCGLS